MALAALAPAACFTKPDFRGEADASIVDAADAPVDAPADAPIDAPDPCGPARRSLPTDLVSDRRTFTSVGDLDVDGLHDLALFGQVPGGPPRVYLYFGTTDHHLDVACFDKELEAGSFAHLAGVHISPAGAGGAPGGTLFLVGLDATNPADVRLEELPVGTDRTVGAPRAAVSSGLPAPAWGDVAEPDAAFLVWRYVEMSSVEEVFFGGGTRLYTVPMLEGGLSSQVSAVPNPEGIRVQQVVDVNASILLVDDGTHLYRATRGPAGSPLVLPEPLDGPTGSGDPGGAVFATHARLEPASVLHGVRVPRPTGTPPRTSVQLYEDASLVDRPLASTTPGPTGPFLTDAVFTIELGPFNAALAAIVTTFPDVGVTARQRLVVDPLGPGDADLVVAAEVALATDVLPAVLATGEFRDHPQDHRTLLVIYPRRTTAAPPTRSSCFHAPGPGMCLAPCEQATCP